MISFLSGQIIYKATNKVELEVNGVGYEIFMPINDLGKLTVDSKAEIYTFHHIAEEKNELFGFLNRKDKTVFEMLLEVSGVGPKTALNVFSAGSGEKILKAISTADVNFFKQVKGLGGKGSQRIIVDLKNKVGSIEDLDFNIESADENIYEALLTLGFTRQEVRKAMGKMPAELKTEDEKIKFCLKEIGK